MPKFKWPKNFLWWCGRNWHRKAVSISRLPPLSFPPLSSPPRSGGELDIISALRGWYPRGGKLDFIITALSPARISLLQSRSDIEFSTSKRGRTQRLITRFHDATRQWNLRDDKIYAGANFRYGKMWKIFYHNYWFINDTFSLHSLWRAIFLSFRMVEKFD